MPDEALWALPPEQTVAHYEAHHKPSVAITDAEAHVGRATLPRAPDAPPLLPGGHVPGAAGEARFARTGHAARIMERVAVLADQHNNVVKISSDPATGQLAISADAQDVGSGSEAIAADVSGEAIQIAFNVRYVLEGLKAMNAERVELRCNAPTTPVVLAPQDDSAFTYLVMPVQIRQ